MHGFILSQQWKDIQDKLQLSFWLSTDSGPQCIQFPQQESVCFCAQDQSEQLPKLSGLRVEPLTLTHFSGVPVCAIYCHTYQLHVQLRQYCEQHSITLWEADIRPTHRFLMERFIKGSLEFNGSTSNENTWVKPHIQASTYLPRLKVLSMDIETSMPTKEQKEKLYSIGFVSQWQDNNGKHHSEKRVYMLGHKEDIKPGWLVFFKNVRELLIAANHYIQTLDPDVIIGWNVINFDFSVLQRVYKEHGIAFHWCRDGSEVNIRHGHNNLNFVDIAGRVIVDGIDALRNATYSFESFSLEFVSQTLLGTGKTLEGHKGSMNNRGQAISDFFEKDKIALANYNANDCQLVLDVFEHTQILQYLIQRSFLTGHLLDRIGGSVAAFEYLYLPKLHRAGFIAPNIGEGFGEFDAPGGFVMESKPGLYQDVLVLDFKSLYPSIIRTFKIDPMGLIEGLKANKTNKEKETIMGFHDAYFHRDTHFLPDIITHLWAERDEAKKQKNSATSQAIKIIMNSFYGILGSNGCRFFDARLASSITLRGHEIIQRSGQWIEQQGFQVIYGDTDSVFISLHTGTKKIANTLTIIETEVIGRKLQDGLNQYWQLQLKKEHYIESQLEIEFESHYQKFLMPTIRGSELGSKKRYAGLTQHDELIFKGLEAVRSDWTKLAKEVQIQLYSRIFHNQPYESYLLNVVHELMAGKRNEQLIYKKRIRKPLNTYVKNIPPQIQAAKLASALYARENLNNPYENGGWIEYIITQQGPVAIECLENTPFKIDYEHYIDKQISPVVDGILYFLDKRFADLINPQRDIFS
ncbi:DNA polymerase II [Pseudomonas sp. HK3]